MRTDDIPKVASHWMPETNAETQGLLGKLGEECCELGARLFRASIQGFYAPDPGDGRSNADHIWDEIADVEAMIAHLRNRRAYASDEAAMFIRKDRKFEFKLPWFDWLKGLCP